MVHERRVTAETLPQQRIVALVGRPNAGKSSLYNQLTGGDARVGNFPGITVDVLEADARLQDGSVVRLVDLPGVYSLANVSDAETDEGITRAFLEREPRPLLVIQVVDATQLALGLRLTREIASMQMRFVVCVTQIDLLEKQGRSLDVKALSHAIGVDVCAVSARAASCREAVLSCVQRALGDTSTHERVTWEPEEVASRVLRERSSERKPTQWTERLDGVLLHPVLGPLCFVGVMTALFAAVYAIADPVTSVIDAVMHALGGVLQRWLGQGRLSSLLVDGLLGGAGTVLAFLPQIVVLTVAMELLEASGYLSRGAFLIDRLLRLVGLGGRSFVPLLTAHACAVPAAAATRIIRDPGERLRTLLVLPLMTCSARLPTYSLLVSTFFSRWSVWSRALLFVGLYAAGVVSGLIAALVMRKTVRRGRGLPLVLEMPAYRAPEPRLVARTAWRACVRFLGDVGTTIVGVSLALWVLLNVQMPFVSHPVAPANAPEAEVRLERSVAASVGRTLEVVTRPVGFDWRINVGLIGSFGAREVMVSTLGVIFGIEDADENNSTLVDSLRNAKRPDGSALYTTRTALSLMAFYVFACQCMSTVAALRRETRSWRWPMFVVGYTYALAFIAAFAVRVVSGALGVA